MGIRMVVVSGRVRGLPRQSRCELLSKDEGGGADCQSLVNCTPYVLVRHNSFLRHLKKEVVNRREDHKLSSSYTDQEVTRHLIVTAPSAPSPALSLSSLTLQQRRKCPSQ